MCVLCAQSCLILCDTEDWSPPGFCVHGILQANILKWVAIFLLQGIFPTPGIKPTSPALQVNSLQLSCQRSPHSDILFGILKFGQGLP